MYEHENFSNLPQPLKDQLEAAASNVNGCKNALRQAEKEYQDAHDALVKKGEFLSITERNGHHDSIKQKQDSFRKALEDLLSLEHQAQGHLQSH